MAGHASAGLGQGVAGSSLGDCLQQRAPACYEDVTEMLHRAEAFEPIDWWSRDDRTMYFIDTAKCTVDAMDCEPATGAVANRRKLVDLPAQDGGWDGMTVDAEGFLWVAMWDRWAARRFTPYGALDRIIRLPCSHVTSVCFGGPDLMDLYITSGRVTETGPLPPEQLAKEPFAGAIFRARPGVRGMPTHPYRG